MRSERKSKKGAPDSSSLPRIRPIKVHVNDLPNATSPGPEDVSAVPNRNTHAAWVFSLRDSVFQELCRIREEYIRATRSGDGLLQHYLIDFANELCEDAPAEMSDAGVVDVPMDGEDDPPQEEIEAEARRFLESMKKTRGK